MRACLGAQLECGAHWWHANRVPIVTWSRVSTVMSWAVHGRHVAVPGLDPAAVATARREAASVLLWTLPRLYSPTLVCARVSRYRRYRESHSRTMVVQVVASMRHALAVASSDQTLHMLEFLKVCGRCVEYWRRVNPTAVALLRRRGVGSLTFLMT